MPRLISQNTGKSDKMGDLFVITYEFEFASSSSTSA